MTKNEEQWLENYEALKTYVKEHHQLPAKSNLEQRKLLNWWKYNRKMINAGKIIPERVKLLSELSKMRTIHKV